MASSADRQLTGALLTSNEQFFDALVRHQIGLLRLTGKVRNDVFKILDATERDMASQIHRKLARSSGLNTPADVNRLQSLLKSIRATRLRAWKQVDEVWLKEILEIAKAEPAFVSGALKTAVPVVIDTVLPSVALLESIVKSRPFQGKTLKQWSKDIQRADLDRIESQIKIGMVQGETTPAIARRVVGTVRLKGRDGVTEITRRQAAGITRTAINGVTNHARRAFFIQNQEFFTKEVYTATLDGRTTPVCRGLDGKRFPVGEGPIPPLHFGCRSLRVAVIGKDIIGTRPARAFTQKGLLKEFTATKNIKGVRSRADLPRGTKGEFDLFARKEMRARTGLVPAKVTYQQWLGRQTPAFQDEVLGVTKGQLFRKGKLPLDRFVARNGSELTLPELAKLDANEKFFRAAGLDPADFR